MSRKLGEEWFKDWTGDPAPFTKKQFEERCDQICGCAGKHDCQCISVFNRAKMELWSEANERGSRVMPRKPNVTDEQVVELIQRTDDVHFDIAAIADEIREGRSDVLTDPIKYARAFSSLARVAADAATAILNKASQQELEAKTKALRDDA